MNSPKKLFIILAMVLFTKPCHAGLTPELQKRFDDFKVSFQKRVKPFLFWGQMSADQVMHQLQHVLPQELHSEEISSLQEHSAQYSEGKDVVSLFMLTAILYAYIPNEQRGFVTKFMMMLQVSFRELMNNQDVEAIHLLQLSLDHFHHTFSEIQINTLVSEANSVITSANHENTLQAVIIPWNKALFSDSHTLLTLMTTEWSLKPKK